MKPTMATETKPSKIHGSLVSHPSFILLDIDEGWREQLGAARTVICNGDQDISDVLAKATNDSLWISSGPGMTDLLLRVTSRCDTAAKAARHRLGNLLMLESPRQKTIPFLRSLFENLVGEAPQFKLLPEDQLCEVLAGGFDAGRDVFVGGVVDTEFSLLMLVHGNFDRMTVPLSIFRPSGTSKPEFCRFELDDYGHTVQFGEYEASADFILYEADPDYRKRMNAKHGAAGRRLWSVAATAANPKTNSARRFPRNQRQDHCSNRAGRSRKASRRNTRCNCKGPWRCPGRDRVVLIGTLATSAGKSIIHRKCRQASIFRDLP